MCPICVHHWTARTPSSVIPCAYRAALHGGAERLHSAAPVHPVCARSRVCFCCRPQQVVVSSVNFVVAGRARSTHRLLDFDFVAGNDLPTGSSPLHERLTARLIEDLNPSTRLNIGPKILPSTPVHLLNAPSAVVPQKAGARLTFVPVFHRRVSEERSSTQFPSSRRPTTTQSSPSVFLFTVRGSNP